ncbi:MAG: hypothetical protein OQK73_06420 [Gammaproteobacteria bacterium]|nr:hypothetical protein [Gammaproteobacteria bacterium]
MRNAALSLAQTPPLSVPLLFFLSAPLFAVACGLILLWTGADAFSSRWHPSLLAATHFLTLGYLAMIMIGALQQLTPILMGVQISHPVIFSRIIFILLSTGTLALTSGWLWPFTGVFTLAGSLLAVAIIGFILVLLLTLRRARPGHASVYSARIALFAFSVTTLLGVYLVLGYSWSSLLKLPVLTNIHMTWGLLGWVSLLIMGIAYQVIPMFQITPEYPSYIKRHLTLFMLFVLSGWTLTYIFFHEKEWLVNLMATILAIGLLIFLLTTLQLLSKRRRHVPDITLNFWRLSMGCLLFSIMVWVLSLNLTYKPLNLLPGILMITGFAMSAVTGMLYKIIPFLIWLHWMNYNPGEGKKKARVPNIKKIIPEQHGHNHFRLHSLMLLLFCLAAFWPDYFLRPAALSLIISSLFLWKNIYHALQLYRKGISSDPL